MKIIVSPSKTMKIRKIDFNSNNVALFNDVTNILLEELKSFDKEYISKKMKIKDKLLDDVYNDILNYEKNEEGNALLSFTGTVFKQLKIKEYSDDNFKYADDNVRILSAFYGVVSAMQYVKKYRLDMNMSIFSKSLYKIWSDVINDYFKDDIILNLASNEYSKMIKKKMVNVDFLVNEKRIAYHSKVARGEILNFLIKNKISDINFIKEEIFNGYRYSKELSGEDNLIFVR